MSTAKSVCSGAQFKNKQILKSLCLNSGNKSRTGIVKYNTENSKPPKSQTLPLSSKLHTASDTVHFTALFLNKNLLPVC